MADATFDGINLIVQLPAAQTSVDVQAEIYSAWKEFLLADKENLRFPQAFTTEGGSPTVPGETSGRNFFLRNDLGWRVRPPEEDINITLVGNLFSTEATLPLIIPTIGAFTVLVNIQRSSLALVEQTGISGLTAQESADLSSTQADAALARKLLGGRRVEISLDDLTVTFYDDDNIAVIAVYSISADGRLRERIA